MFKISIVEERSQRRLMLEGAGWFVLGPQRLRARGRQPENTFKAGS